jgi:predicted nucleic acid-binding protein
MPDDHSPEAARQVMKLPEAVSISSLVALEAINAMQLRVFRRERTVRQAADSVKAFEQDISAGVLRFRPAPVSAWELARKLSLEYSANIGTRSLDILQVAIAIVFRADTFLTFDRNQATLARAEGLQTPIQP